MNRVFIRVTPQIIKSRSQLSYPTRKMDEKRIVYWKLPVYRADIYQENEKGKDVRITNNQPYSDKNKFGYFSADRFGIEYDPSIVSKTIPSVVGLIDGHLHQLEWKFYNKAMGYAWFFIKTKKGNVKNGSRKYGEGELPSSGYLVHAASYGLIGCIGIHQWKEFRTFLVKIASINVNKKTNLSEKDIDLWIWLDQLSKRPPIKKVN